MKKKERIDFEVRVKRNGEFYIKLPERIIPFKQAKGIVEMAKFVLKCLENEV